MSNPLNAFFDALTFAGQSGLAPTFLLAWVAAESGWGAASAQNANHNWLSVAATGWIEQISCGADNRFKRAGTNTYFACFSPGDDFGTAITTALWSLNGVYLGVAVAAQDSGNSLGGVAQAIADRAFDAGNPGYGALVRGVYDILNARINCVK